MLPALVEVMSDTCDENSRLSRQHPTDRRSFLGESAERSENQRGSDHRCPGLSPAVGVTHGADFSARDSTRALAAVSAEALPRRHIFTGH